GARQARSAEKTGPQGTSVERLGQCRAGLDQQQRPLVAQGRDPYACECLGCEERADPFPRGGRGLPHPLLAEAERQEKNAGHPPQWIAPRLPLWPEGLVLPEQRETAQAAR